jgi:L-Ala-D/L-Glu epimerase
MTLRKKIKHASQERSASDNLIVVIHLDDGHVGYGEGVPREYVTGETIESAFERLREWNLPEIAGEPRSFGDVVRAMDLWNPEPLLDDLRGIRSNSARCAAELSILDAFARHFQVTIGEAVRLSSASAEIDHGDPMTVRYSGAITAETPWKERVSATKMRIWGFRQVKVKVGIPGQDDVARLRRIRRRLGGKCEIRLDANEAWTPSQFETWSERLAFANPAAYEQPVPHESIACLGGEDFRSSCPVILDESLCGMKDADAAIQGGFGEIFNIRLSKCGGLVPSLRLAARAIQSGRRFGLGCHPGESPILSAAGRAFACRVRNLAFWKARTIVMFWLILSECRTSPSVMAVKPIR